MPLNLKITWGAGASSARLMGLEDGTTLADLKAIIATKSSIDPSSMQLKAGFPPKDVSGSQDDPVVQLGIASGSAITVLEQKQTTSSAVPSSAPPRASFPTPLPPAPTSSFSLSDATAAVSSTSAPRIGEASSIGAMPPQVSVPPEMVRSLTEMGFPEDMAAKALEVAGGDLNTALEMCMGGDPAMFAAGAAAPPAPRGVMIRRIIDADNSCLFNSVGYALRRKRKVGSELRLMITQAVRSSPDIYNEAILGKDPEEYCRWISDTKSWGGEIELSILSKKLAVMITVVDIQTNNTYSYGEEGGYPKRILIIYDGVHYDALAQAAGENAPEEDDVTVFNPTSPGTELEMAKALAADLKSKNQFTDMGNCDLKCMVCMKLLAGQKGALEHARATGHQNFGQI